jgi:hypothetical protein
VIKDNRILLGPLLLMAFAWQAAAADPWLVFEGKSGPGRGKHVVLISGDEEYRSEEAMPQLAQILAERHGFRTTVLFAIDHDGTVNPERRDNIPGLENLKNADLAILFIRFRDLPDDQMKHIVDYLNSGRPVIVIRTATHPFDLKTSPTYRRYTWNNKDPEFEGGFGRQVAGETWLNHHGKHGVQSARGIIAPGAEKHPILRGIEDGAIWGPTDVYGVRLPLPGDSQPLILGQVLEGMNPSDPPVSGKQNDPMMPMAWVKTYKGDQGKTSRVFTSTMGSSQDLQNEAFRRLLVNAVYWAVGMEKQIPAKANVDLVGNFQASPFKFGGHRKGLRPEDFR